MNPRLAFVFDGSNGKLRYTMMPEQMKRVGLLDDDIVVVSDEFENVRPDVYYDLIGKVIRLNEPKPEKKPSPVLNRINAYPNFGDQLDAIYKGFKAMDTAGVYLPPETVKWIEAVDKVKRDNPKE